MKVHSCFGVDGHLQVFDIWESQDAWGEFLGYPVPILQDLGIAMSPGPVIMPVVDLAQ
jgi:hypothetical protein